MFSTAFPQTGRLTVALCDFLLRTRCHGKSMKIACYLRLYWKTINSLYFRSFLLFVLFIFEDGAVM